MFSSHCKNYFAVDVTGYQIIDVPGHSVLLAIDTMQLATQAS
jgi:hypothetical protein